MKRIRLDAAKIMIFFRKNKNSEYFDLFSFVYCCFLFQNNAFVCVRCGGGGGGDDDDGFWSSVAAVVGGLNGFLGTELLRYSFLTSNLRNVR